MASADGSIRRREALLLGPQNGASKAWNPATRGGQTWPPRVAGFGAVRRPFLAPKTAPFRCRIPPLAEAKRGRRWRDPAPCCAFSWRPKRRLVAPSSPKPLWHPLPPRTLRDRPSVRHPGKFAFADGHFDRRGASLRTDGHNVASLRTDGCGRVRARKHRGSSRTGCPSASSRTEADGR